MKTLELDNYNTINGTHADILIDQRNRRVYKIFIGPDHPSISGTGELHIGRDAWVRYRTYVFKNEVAAYELLEQTPRLLIHAPTFHGVEGIASVTRKGIDISREYLLDCCYVMEMEDGEARKANDILNNSVTLKECHELTGFRLDEVVEAFQTAGVRYTFECSVFCNPRRLALIDFSLVDPQEYMRRIVESMP